MAFGKNITLNKGREEVISYNIRVLGRISSEEERK